MCAVFFLILVLVTKNALVEARLQCDAGLVEVDHWCAAADPNTGKCPLTKRNINGVLHDIAASYPHGRTCSWPCGAPAAVDLNPLFTEEYKRLLAGGKTAHESLTGGRERAWSECRSLCNENASCTAYTLDFKYFGCTLSTQAQPCGEFKYSCHTAANGGTWWETGANCGVNAALHRYTVKACRAVDHTKSCTAARPVTTTTTTAATTTKKAVATTTTTRTTTKSGADQLKCDAGLVEVDHWCAAADPNTGKCPLTKRNINGVLHDIAASYPHGRTCSWPCGAPAAVDLNPLFTEEYKRLLAGGKTVHESLTGGRARAWSECRSLCNEDARCTAYTLDFKYFGCTLSTQAQPCGEFKYSCHTAANGGTWWETGANCGVNAALHRYTVKACRAVDHTKACTAARPVATTTTTTAATTNKAVVATATTRTKDTTAAATATTTTPKDTTVVATTTTTKDTTAAATTTTTEDTTTTKTTTKKAAATAVPRKPLVTPTTKLPTKTCYSVGDPHLSSFAGVRFDNHAVGWQTLYEKGELKIEAQQAKWRAGNTGVAINRAYRVTYNGQVTQGDGGQMPTSNGEMRFTSPAVKLTVQAVDFTRLAWAADKFIYNIYVTTAETVGAEGLCTRGSSHRRLDESKPAFPTNPLVSEQQAIAACAGLETQSDNCVTDVRMSNDPAAIDVISKSFKVVEETVERLEPSTTNFRGPRIASAGGTLEVVSAVVAYLAVVTAI